MKYLSLFALVFALGLTACDSTDPEASSSTITEAVVADADLSILEQAVIAAGLDDALNDEDEEYTVFAPTNAAFAAALTALDITAEELLAREDLASILQLHVIFSRDLEANDLQDGDTIETLNGQTLTIVVSGSRIGLDTEDAGSTPNAFVTTADIRVSNGVVHKIDSVLLPN